MTNTAPARAVVCFAAAAALVAASSIAEAQPFAYVLGERSGATNLVTVIDTATNTRVASIPVGRGTLAFSGGLASSPDGSRVYAANVTDETISVIDTATNTVIAAIPSGPKPSTVVVSPDGARLYVGNSTGFPSQTAVRVINAATGATLGVIPLATPFTMGMAISPDGRRVYASGWTGMDTGYTVKVIDTVAGAVIATIPVGRFAVDVEVTPDGSVVYVTHLTTGTGHLSVINAATNALATTVAVGVNPYSLAVTPDGNRVLVPANGVPFSVAVVNRHTNTVTGSIPGLVHMRAIDITSDGARAIVAAEEGVAMFDIVANTRLDTIPFDTVAEGSPKAVTVLPTPPAPPTPPTDLIASSIDGNVVTLQWHAPVSGTPPTGYVVEGGIFPGQTLAAIPTASQLPTFTFTAPSGVFYVRMRALAGGVRSGPSNEIRISANPPMAPSAPEGLVGLVNGSSLALAWRNTLAGGATTAIVLEVTGSITTSLALGSSEALSFDDIPDGTYTLAVRATNPFGTSALSNAVTVAFPGACSGVPLAPENFRVYKAGSTIFVWWDPAATGPAPTGFVLHVTGAFVGSIPTTGQSLSGVVAPGTYNLHVAATNPCGEGAATPVQVVTMP